MKQAKQGLWQWSGGTRAIASAVRADFRLWRRMPKLARLLQQVRPYTMVSDAALVAAGRQIIGLVDERIPGALVECGVWKGGVAFLMAALARELRSERRVYLCDSFEGLPPPKPIDGPAAIKWAEDSDEAWYHDNCRARMGDVQRSARELGVDSTTIFVPGWFDKTLPKLREDLPEIAYLRIDADWHESVLTCLQELY